MKATEKFIMLCNVVLTFETVDEILKLDHSNERYKVVKHVTFESVFLQSGHSNLKLLGITSFYTKQTFSEFLPGNNDCFGRQVSLQIFAQNRTQTFPHPSKLSLEDRVLHF